MAVQSAQRAARRPPFVEVAEPDQRPPVVFGEVVQQTLHFVALPGCGHRIAPCYTVLDRCHRQPCRAISGRGALAAQKASSDTRKLVGLLVEDRAVLRSHQKVIVAAVGEGEVTSGTFSPTLQRSIGFARVPARTGDRCEVEIRGKLVAARVVRPPFVRHGKVAIAL